MSATASRARRRAFAPASVGNIGVGFDLLGHASKARATSRCVRRIDEPVVRIAAIRGDVAGADSLPLEAARNTAGAALIALREKLWRSPYGFELELEKGIPLGSGLGGSAASCVAALVAANALLDAPLSREALYAFALDGESVSSGSRHGDNVAPMLLGGVVLATATRMIPLAVPRLPALPWSCTPTRCWRRAARARCWPSRIRCRWWSSRARTWRCS